MRDSEGAAKSSSRLLLQLFARIVSYCWERHAIRSFCASDLAMKLCNTLLIEQDAGKLRIMADMHSRGGTRSTHGSGRDHDGSNMGRFLYSQSNAFPVGRHSFSYCTPAIPDLVDSITRLSLLMLFLLQILSWLSLMVLEDLCFVTQGRRSSSADTTSICSTRCNAISWSKPVSQLKRSEPSDPGNVKRAIL